MRAWRPAARHPGNIEGAKLHPAPRTRLVARPWSGDISVLCVGENLGKIGGELPQKTAEICKVRQPNTTFYEVSSVSLRISLGQFEH